jgi:hypothetical protein
MGKAMLPEEQHPFYRPWLVAGLALAFGCSGTSDVAVFDGAPGLGVTQQALAQSPLVSVTVVSGALSSVEEFYPAAVRPSVDVPWWVPACEPSPGQELTRTECPTQPPEVTGCEVEGLECRYSDEGSTAQLYECIFGRWSYVKQEQAGGEAPASVSSFGEDIVQNAASCPAGDPLPDAPCTGDQLCGYSPCVIGRHARLLFTCNCGRWTLEHRGCPVD